MRRLVVPVLFLLAACGSANLAQPHTVALAYKAGDTYKYNLAASLKYTIGAQGVSLPFSVDVSGKETVTVKSVDSSGTADLSVVLTDMMSKVTINGTTNTTTTTTSQVVDMKVASDGRIVSVNGNALGSSGSLPGVSQLGGGMVTAILPDGPVKPGDTWTKNYDENNPNGGSAIHVTSKNKYLRDEKLKGVDTAVIQSNIADDIDVNIDMSALGGMFPVGGGAGGGSATAGASTLTMKGSVTSDVTSWIETSAKRLAKTHSTGNLDATMTINLPAGAAPNPYLSGPITFKGTQTMDMTPA